MAKLIFNNKIFDYPINKDLFVLQKDTGIFISSSCYKQGLCKECVIKIEKGNEFLNEPTKYEKHLKYPYRLACQTKIIDEAGIVECSTLKRNEIVIEESSTGSLINKNINLDPAVKKDSDNNVFIDSVQVGKTENNILGLAIDIGTTTVVLKLADLTSGAILKTISFENPQRFAGSNVMSRIHYDSNDKTKQLKRILNSHIYNAIRKMTSDPQNIFDVIIAGNTTMRDIFFGIDVTSVGQSPYISITESEYKTGKRPSTALSFSGKRMRLPVNTNARVHSLPLIGNHIGSDIAAGLISTDFYNKEEWQVFIDMGTNTEIVLGNKDIAFASSSPSGPAFEGGGITFGMPALKGAIEKVKIFQDHVEYLTIGNIKPVGICGSGLIDIMGELKRADLIDVTGRFKNEHPYLKDDKFFLDKENDIFITENDLNQLAQAKGANSAAFEVLMTRAGIEKDEIGKFYLAGGFGKHIDLDQAKLIGLLPDLPNEIFIKTGNTSIDGLTIALFDKNKKTQIENFIKKIKVINLESEGSFFDFFVEGCLFKSIDSYETEFDDF